MKTKSDWVNYPADFPLDKEAAENILMLKAALGDPDEEEFRDYMVRCAQRRQARQEAAMKSAKALLGRE